MNVSTCGRNESPDPRLWREPPMRDALIRRDIGAVFLLLHRRHGMTQRRIGELAGFAASEVYEVIHGRKIMAYDVLVRIAEGLGVPRGLMGLAHDEGPATRPGTVPLPLENADQRQQFIAALAGVAVGGPPALDAWLPHTEQWPGPVPEAVSPATVSTVREITDRHRRLDATYGGGSCRDSALGYLLWARCLLRSPCPDEILAADLCGKLADLHNLVGWMCHDLGQHTAARRYLAQGLVLAQKADDVTLMADSYYRLGRVSIHQDDPREALHLFQLGLMVATTSSCPTSAAILHANIGWAHAKMGNAAAVRDSLARAGEELGRADSQAAPQWTRFFSSADLAGMSGVVHAALAHHDEHRKTHALLAIEHAGHALNGRDATSRSGAFDHVTAATGHALLGEGRAVIPHATAVLAATGQVRSRRLLDRLDGLADVVDPHTGRNSSLHNLVTKIRTLTGA
ncbi:hypothetical protein [Actinoplanes sp. NPDC051859]|uniref:hypothetical protein n=1 Tax=Actinoplanes sp. NPDC051859 TaxID=3363909 RepID=UPI0037AC402B